MSFDFEAQLHAVQEFLTARRPIVEALERRLLNVGGKPAARIRDRARFEEALVSCVCGATADPRQTAARMSALEEAHVADGFVPLFRSTHAHQLDLAVLLVAAYEHWDRTRWPGTNMRLRHAEGIHAAFLLRYLQNLTLRIWDGGDADAPSRLAAIQRLLDEVNATAPRPLVREAAWLLQTAQGPLTKGLAPYFRVAARVAASFGGAEAIAIHAAGARLAGGHLRSQLRYRAAEIGRPPASAEALVMARNSNAMDLALLVWDLVPLLDAYAAAGEKDRPIVADAILQGCSADPELLLTRLDLLAPYTTIETVCVSADAESVALTAAGEAHARLLQRYGGRLDEVAPSLLNDFAALDPGTRDYSPLGLTYGFCADLLTGMAVETLAGREDRDASLEDLFGQGPAGPADYSHDWARERHAQVLAALEARAAHPGRANASGTPPAMLVLSDSDSDAQQYCVTSDVQLALATGATAFPRGQIAGDRDEGRYLASADRGGRWFGVSKAVLTERLAQGRDARMVVPDEVSRILRLTCPDICRF
jgi:hypothetical protein